jgi:predicted transcriptional regulator
VPSQHLHQPLSLRLPKQLRNWLIDFAGRHDRPVSSVVIEAIEEYVARQEGSRGRRDNAACDYRECS